MRDAVPAARKIKTLVNTHANGDHTFGNQLITDAEIITTKETAEEMFERQPTVTAGLKKNYKQLGEGGAFLYEVMGQHFAWEDVRYTAPTRTFSGQLDLKIGDKAVHLIYAGPAHTKGDTLVWVPKDKTLFAGDLMFVGGHPVIWAGPVGNWIKACDLILGLDVDVIVPGHGPITDKKGVAQFKSYLEYIHAEARKLYDAGVDRYTAATMIKMDPYLDWLDSERIVINVASLYREFGASEQLATLDLWTDMSRFHKAGLCNCARQHKGFQAS
jgi:glyoxylase-like metal-dependent hydrolase (beta-lactamase superfamily II)